MPSSRLSRSSHAPRAQPLGPSLPTDEADLSLVDDWLNAQDGLTWDYDEAPLPSPDDQLPHLDFPSPERREKAEHDDFGLGAALRAMKGRAAPESLRGLKERHTSPLAASTSSSQPLSVWPSSSPVGKEEVSRSKVKKGKEAEVYTTEELVEGLPRPRKRKTMVSTRVDSDDSASEAESTPRRKHTTPIRTPTRRTAKRRKASSTEEEEREVAHPTHSSTQLTLSQSKRLAREARLKHYRELDDLTEEWVL